MNFCDLKKFYDQEKENIIWDNMNNNIMKLFNYYYDISEVISRKLFKDYSHTRIEFDDIKQLTDIALWKTLLLFERSKGKPFIYYANFKIPKLVIDNIRSLRGSRRKNFYKIESAVSLDSPIITDIHHDASDHKVMSYYEVLSDERDYSTLDRSVVADSISEVLEESFFCERDISVFKYVRFEDHTMAETGEYFNISESRVCQIVKKIQTYLKQKLDYDSFV